MCFLVGDELLLILFCQASEHEAEHGQVNHGLAAAREILVILTHAAIAADPGQRTLDDPATLPPQTVFCFCVLAIVHSFRDSLV